MGRLNRLEALAEPQVRADEDQALSTSRKGRIRV